MLLNLAPNNEAIMSNVGQIGEFRIRNSAKAFNILSSGLYANKIRAIIRELSCNAVDSHVAAGKQETPFDVHIPTRLEPWFAIRDYGTGLTHEQVTNIYTTYFESTKTNSNDFIGALGLGSKSPFSYTDNFTVTAVKDGVRGVYTAFINNEGVPSIALMHSETSEDPSGVEVKFSVNDQYDFRKFYDEARQVYTYFKLRPVVSGVDNFDFRNVTYDKMDIVPGVHSYDNDRGCVAIMGNIAYPVDMPNAESNLGELSNLLSCGLEMHFAIGELDFQASREGLSYIPQTIASIKTKLEAVNAALAVVLTAEADAITNLWDRAVFLMKKRESRLWGAAVRKYINDTKFPLITGADGNGYMRYKEFEFDVKELANTYNIELAGFSKSRGSVTCTPFKSSQSWDSTSGQQTGHHWDISVNESAFFIKNDLKTGALARAKYHWKNAKFDNAPYSSYVFVMSKVDKTKAVDFDGFLNALMDPPRVMLASSLLQEERKARDIAKNVTILELQESNRGYGEMVWRDAGKADQFLSGVTYYYLPLSGYNIISNKVSDAKHFRNTLKQSGYSELSGITIYGVRKGDMEWVSKQANWVNLETHVKNVLAKTTDSQKFNIAMYALDIDMTRSYNATIAKKVKATSPYAKMALRLQNVQKISRLERSALDRLLRDYEVKLDLDTVIKQIGDEVAAVTTRYPLLGSLSGYGVNPDAVAEYIDLIDEKKGV